MSFCHLARFTNSSFDLGARSVGGDAACFIIAEAGVNHDGDMSAAIDLVHAAADAGADAVKFQTFTAAALATRSAKKAKYQQATTDSAETHYEMLQRLELDGGQHVILQDIARARGIEFLSSPFSEQAADMLNDLNVPAFKIPSGEITNIDLLRHVGSFKRPVILSTGMANLGEIRSAVEWLGPASNVDIVLLHCVSNYPAKPEDCNLRAMETMSQEFGLPIGFSDHTLGADVAIAAVALGACVVEKHITLDTTRDGPDHAASMAAHDFVEFVARIRSTESALGHGRKEPVASEAEVAAVARRSLVAAMDIVPGTVIDGSMLIARREEAGMLPSERDRIVGRTAHIAIAAGTLLHPDMLR
jgi:N,N'-diacetyllegionaminate synthase